MTARRASKDGQSLIKASPDAVYETRLPVDGKFDVHHLQQLSYWLDDAVRIPGTNRRIGIDALLGLLPGVGDAATMALSAYILFHAARLGLPLSTLGRMGLNIGIDSVLGAIPIIGDLFDVAWRSNRRNLKLLLTHLDADRASRSR